MFVLSIFCVHGVWKSPGHVVVCVHFVSVCFVFHSSYSETVEENPYRPTYIFPESNDRPLRTRGTLVIVLIWSLIVIIPSTLVFRASMWSL